MEFPVLLAVGILAAAAAAVVVLVLAAAALGSGRNETSSGGSLAAADEEDGPKVKVDVAKALYQTSKFALRLKRQVKRFRARKAASGDLAVAAGPRSSRTPSS